jgi:hypothetical protein
MSAFTFREPHCRRGDFIPVETVEHQARACRQRGIRRSRFRTTRAAWRRRHKRRRCQAHCWVEKYLATQTRAECAWSPGSGEKPRGQTRSQGFIARYGNRKSSSREIIIPSQETMQPQPSLGQLPDIRESRVRVGIARKDLQPIRQVLIDDGDDSIVGWQAVLLRARPHARPRGHSGPFRLP